MEIATNYAGSVMEHSEAFDTGVGNLKDKLDGALSALQSKPSDVTLLAKYQAALSEYNIYRQAQSNSTKRMSDLALSIISNFR